METAVKKPLRIEWTLVRAHAVAAFAGLLLSAIFGLLVSLKFHAPSFLSENAALTWGRLRYDHTQGILYAWLGNAFLAFFYYALPHLIRRGVTSRRLGLLIFCLWNFVAVLGGWTLVLSGVSQPLEWAEFPLIIAAVIEVAWVLLIVQFVLPFLRCGAADVYVAGWYLLGGITFTSLAYPLGNIMPHVLPGAMGAAFSGLWIHDAVGIFITPFAVAIAYFVIPAVTERPIFSHFYSMVGFWVLFLVYPLNGIHHYIYSSLPMGAQHVSEVASIYQGLDVVLVVTNLLLSIPVAVAAVAFTNVALRFVWTSVVLYLIVSLQGSIQAIMTFNRFIHFSDWVIGHSHLAMIGFASFAAMGGLAHIWPRIPGVRFNSRAVAWSYWLLILGLALMVADLTGAGLVQASLWNGHLPWIESVRSSQPYWLMRTISGCVLITGFLTFAGSFFTGPRSPAQALPEPPPGDAPETASGQRARFWLNSAYAATFGAGLLFYMISFLALGVFPAVRLRGQIARTTPPHAFIAFTPAELRGRQIYAQNGCAYCHTQQVRFTPADQRRFGHPTQAWETQHEYPQMWGTRRVGPDLARESGKHSDDWQLVHLFNPRYVVPDSIMPSYPWLFTGSAASPTSSATDLVAYLNILGRAGASPPQNIAAVEQILPAAADLDSGQEVFARDCSGCHAADGTGASPGGRALRPVAFNLAGNELDPQLIVGALRHGVAGTAMPSWTELPADEFQAVLSFTLSLGHAPDLAADRSWAPPDVLLEAGHRVYTTHCALCHGDTGTGNGPDAGKYVPPPANFEQLKPSYQAAAEVIHQGVQGSGMAAWPLLTDPEIQAVTYYIRSFYRASPKPPIVSTSGAAHSTMERMP
ncbi:MAG TPA: hypothetical protein DEQ47_13670 [Solibacterales bacterium]|nr:hypothetical protein [Bryobacterales bacterium]